MVDGAQGVAGAVLGWVPVRVLFLREDVNRGKESETEQSRNESVAHGKSSSLEIRGVILAQPDERIGRCQPPYDAGSPNNSRFAHGRNSTPMAALNSTKNVCITKLNAATSG